MNFDIVVTRLTMGVSAAALAFGLAEVGSRIMASPEGASIAKMSLFALFALTALSLFYGNIVYQLTRIGQLRRHLSHESTKTARGNLLSAKDAAPVTVLIPSYREEIPVLMQTVISAALSEYPARRVTVLIDDPPVGNPADQVALRAARGLIVELDEFFRNAAHRFALAARDYSQRERLGRSDLKREQQILASLYDEAVFVVESIGRRYAELSQPAFAHADELFVREIIDLLASRHREAAKELRSGNAPGQAVIRKEYDRLSCLFAVPINSFERKQFANLSHAPNKAMNLNSYIGLIGRAFRIRSRTDRLPILEETPASAADMVVPAAEYIVTLDADSIILPDYIAKLVAIMDADQGIAIAQTPYSAFPNPPSVLERVAGATTDIQYLVHQGFTAFNATFWVGANAVIRREALEQIKTMAEERGYAYPIFVQDKTLIEDTGSTIDLAARGWRLHNHPERLAYSATPSNFGALAIQRRRWANGGLIIFPSLVDLWSRGRSTRAGHLETIIRSHYLLSPALANVGLLFLLIFPFGNEFFNVWFPAAAAPYYMLYGRDLKRCGYQWRDLLRIYALNLMLLPVNLAGVYHSVVQMMNGRKTPFARTPKIEGRTAAPASYLLALWVLTAAGLVSAGLNLWCGHLLFFLFSAINSGFFIYGLLGLIGWREALADIRLGLRVADEDTSPVMGGSLAEQPNV